MQSTPASPGKRHHYSPAAQTCTLGVISDSSFFSSSHLPTQSRSASKYFCCRMGNPFQGLEGSSCLTLRNELSKETYMQIKQEILLGRGAWVESRKVRESTWVAVLGFYGDGISFWVVSCQSFRLRVLSDGTCIAQPRWIPMRMILEGGRTRGSLWPSPNSPGW